MVRIERRTMNGKGSKGVAFASQWTLKQHFFVVFQVILIFCVIGLYLLLRSQEVGDMDDVLIHTYLMGSAYSYLPKLPSEPSTTLSAGPNLRFTFDSLAGCVCL